MGVKTPLVFMYYLFGDYLSGILIGVLTALGVRLFVSPGWNMVLAMMVGVGVGIVIHLPLGADIVAIDVSPKMLERAERKARSYAGNLQLRLADVQHLDFPDNTLDTALTVCTFCSVPNPVKGLKELRRVLKPRGQLLMFEHVRSQIPLCGLFLDFMTYLSRRFGPDLNRDTVGNVLKAGFRLRRVENVYLDIVKTIEAVK